MSWVVYIIFVSHNLTLYLYLYTVYITRGAAARGFTVRYGFGTSRKIGLRYRYVPRSTVRPKSYGFGPVRYVPQYVPRYVPAPVNHGRSPVIVSLAKSLSFEPLNYDHVPSANDR